MTYDWLNVGSPYFWLFWSGLILGASINRATRPHVRRDRWSLVYFYLTVVAAGAACAIVVPALIGAAPRTGMATTPGALFSKASPSDPVRFLFAAEWKTLLIYVGAVALLGLVGARYPLAAALPMVVAGALFIVWTGATMIGTHPYHRAGVIGSFRVLAVDEHDIALELDALQSDRGRAAPLIQTRALPQRNATDLTTIEAPTGENEVVAVVDLFAVPKWCFFLPAQRFYRIAGLKAPEQVADLDSPPNRIPVLSGTPLFLPPSPVVKSHRVLSPPVRPLLLETYEIVVGRDSTVHVEAKIKE